MSSFPKDGSLVSAVYLGFVRRMSCWFCDRPAPSEAHHYPPKGRGVTDDSKTVPACPWCHQRCEGIVVVCDGKRLEPIAERDQQAAVDAVLRVFLTSASSHELKQYRRDADRYRESRIYTVPA